ncbi:hypothetical protein [Rhizobium sp. TRM95796]|uniref:hypothetical protein n=1 Tax=Rhizobium sp. TRM95796 TaxID=2979862 RepID=UPI0021E86455|nr:hypothetical protein [Rhizobium sp. TRM95796]MCV3766466.1 hypothetical protein [Rhizobium sp. TRM95796]
MAGKVAAAADLTKIMRDTVDALIQDRKDLMSKRLLQPEDHQEMIEGLRTRLRFVPDLEPHLIEAIREMRIYAQMVRERGVTLPPDVEESLKRFAL